jgi:peptide/nickel transport system substrate-binding protein
LVALVLRSGALDGALLDDRLPPAELDLIARTEGLVVRPLVGTAHHTVFFDTSQPPFDDVKVRRALVRSVSVRELMAATGISNGVRYESGIARAHWSYSQLNVPAADAAAVDEALHDAGWERGSDGVRELEGVRLAFTLSTSDDPTRVAIAEELARAWSEIGAEVEVAPFDSVRYLDDHVLVRDFEAALITVDPGPDPDPYPFWHSSQIAEPGRNLSNYSLGELDDVLERARQTHDNERRQELYSLFGGYIIGQAPAMPLFAPPRFYVQSIELQGFEESLQFSRASRFDSVAGWYLRTRIER